MPRADACPGLTIEQLRAAVICPAACRGRSRTPRSYLRVEVASSVWGCDDASFPVRGASKKRTPREPSRSAYGRPAGHHRPGKAATSVASAGPPCFGDRVRCPTGYPSTWSLGSRLAARSLRPDATWKSLDKDCPAQYLLVGPRQCPAAALYPCVKRLCCVSRIGGVFQPRRRAPSYGASAPTRQAISLLILAAMPGFQCDWPFYERSGTCLA